MIFLYFAIGAIVYVISATLSYSEAAKQSVYYFPVGIVAAVIANVCWLAIAKSQSNVSELFLVALFWDVMLTMIFMIVPFVLFSASVSSTQGIGIAAITIGIILTKLG